MIRFLSVALLSMVMAVGMFGQTTASPTPDATAQTAALQAQIELLQKQKEYEKIQFDIQDQRLKALLEAVKSDAKPPPNVTTVKAEEKPSVEVSALSYQALNELSTQVVKAIGPAVRRYQAIVVYNEPDFLTLAKYRLYRHQTDLALTEYRRLKDDLASEAAKMGNVNCDDKANADHPRCKGGRTGIRGAPMIGGFKTGGASSLLPIFAAPEIAKNLIGSAADIIAMFRSETILTPSRDTVDESALATAMGSALLANDQNLDIFVPAAFVPEYDLDIEGRDSILMRVSDVNQAYVDMCDFLAQTDDLTPAEKKQLKDLIDRAEVSRAHLQGLIVVKERLGARPRTTTAPSAAAASAAASDEGAQPMEFSDLRGLIRAEKLERFLRQGAPAIGAAGSPRVGILKVHGLSSGGSRRETRNLVFGNKIRFSGSLVFEVQMFDVDGMLRSSNVFSGTTGFQKFESRR